MKVLARVLLLFLLAPAALAFRADTSLYVALDGSDGGSGTETQPFATLERARDEARKRKADGPVTIFVRGGIYTLPRTLQLGAQDSGTADAPIVWRNYPGEAVTLSGGVPISGFAPWKGSIRVADASAFIKTPFRQLFYAGTRQILARYPNFTPEQADLQDRSRNQSLNSDRIAQNFGCRYKPGTARPWSDDIACDIIHQVADRTVLDTDVLVAAMRSDRGASRVLLIAALERRYPLLASVPLMLEYESVVTRPEHLEAAGLSVEEMQVLLDAIAAVVGPIRISYLWRPLLPDAQDDMVLETAVNGRADSLVTFNRRHFEPAAATFGLNIRTPGEAVQRLENRA